MNQPYHVGDVVQIISEEEVLSRPRDSYFNRYLLGELPSGTKDYFDAFKLALCGKKAVITNIEAGYLYDLSPLTRSQDDSDWFRSLFSAAEFHLVTPQSPSLTFDDLLKGAPQ